MKNKYWCIIIYYVHCILIIIISNFKFVIGTWQKLILSINIDKSTFFFLKRFKTEWFNITFSYSYLSFIKTTALLLIYFEYTYAILDLYIIKPAWNNLVNK